MLILDNVELERPGSALAAVRNALVTFAQRKDLSSAQGCMGLNAISEFGQRDVGVTRITRNAARAAASGTNARAYQSKKTERNSRRCGPGQHRGLFESTLAGIRMAAKAGKSRRALRNIAAFASRAYLASDRRITPEWRATRKLSVRPVGFSNDKRACVYPLSFT